MKKISWQWSSRNRVVDRRYFLLCLTLNIISEIVPRTKSNTSFIQLDDTVILTTSHRRVHELILFYRLKTFTFWDFWPTLCSLLPSAWELGASVSYCVYVLILYYWSLMFFSISFLLHTREALSGIFPLSHISWRPVPGVLLTSDRKPSVENRARFALCDAKSYPWNLSAFVK